jgi:hypothetical protein
MTPPLDTAPGRLEVASALFSLRHFIGRAQAAALRDALRGEERDYFAGVLIDLAHRVANMPHEYQQDGKGRDAVVYLHYFAGSCDWWITERDSSEEQLQAFGLADMGEREFGYICIDEAIAAGAELDLYWSPKTLKEANLP